MNRQQVLLRGAAIAAAVLIPCAIVAVLLSNRSSRSGPSSHPRSIDSDVAPDNEVSRLEEKSSSSKRHVTILYATCTGTSKMFARKLEEKLSVVVPAEEVSVINVSELDEDQLDKLASSGGIFLFILSTWTEGTLPESAARFKSWLDDLACDFRVSRDHFHSLLFAVFGCGGIIYRSNYCKAAREVNDHMTSLGAVPLAEPVFGDDASHLESKFEAWSSSMCTAVVAARASAGLAVSDVSGLRNVAKLGKKPKKEAGTPQYRHVKTAPATTCSQPQTSAEASSGSGGAGGCCGGGSSSSAAQSGSSCCKGEGGAAGDGTGLLENEEDDDEEEEDRINLGFVTMDMEEGEEEEEEEEVQEQGGGCGSGGGDGLDMEDLGAVIQSQRAKAQERASEVVTVEREMVTRLQRKALTKEGYKIIGSHSAVKLCRWTKNQMRGRGGCYKHSFYGITSYQCMEATPSLACANKCVFCWRHHKNPVGTDWRWKTDDPAHIVEQAVELHRAMIHEMKGVPGVLPERLADAHTVRHCALSLVGEPIMYPRINEMLKELHDREISSFLVTNAQFPDRIRDLWPVTQLYVSVDAPGKDALKAIDRPLFRDFWERYIECLREVKNKKQRTVFRMTLVKDWNMQDDEGYAELIEIGQPDFIEIKAMTYCGKSDASSLTMQNVPWHKDVCEYSEALAARLNARGKGPRYSVATEHEHSCCILLAREDKFLVDGVWHTWIDYPRFHALMRRYYESAGQETFRSEDYMYPTPEWALYKSQARGFDPLENRWKRTKAGAIVEIDYKSSSSGCG